MGIGLSCLLAGYASLNYITRNCWIHPFLLPTVVKQLYADITNEAETIENNTYLNPLSSLLSSQLMSLCECSPPMTLFAASEYWREKMYWMAETIVRLPYFVHVPSDDPHLPPAKFADRRGSRPSHSSSPYSPSRRIVDPPFGRDILVQGSPETCKWLWKQCVYGNIKPFGGPIWLLEIVRIKNLSVRLNNYLIVQD